MIRHTHIRLAEPVSGWGRVSMFEGGFTRQCLGYFLVICVGLLSVFGGDAMTMVVHDDHDHVEISTVDLAVDSDHHSHEDTDEERDPKGDGDDDSDHHHHLVSSGMVVMIAVPIEDAALFQSVTLFLPSFHNVEGPTGPADELIKPPQAG